MGFQLPPIVDKIIKGINSVSEKSGWSWSSDPEERKRQEALYQTDRAKADERKRREEYLAGIKNKTEAESSGLIDPWPDKQRAIIKPRTELPTITQTPSMALPTIQPTSTPTTVQPTPTVFKSIPIKTINLGVGKTATIFNTPHDTALDTIFGDKADEARQALKWGEGKGENPNFITGPGWIDPNTGEHGDWNHKTIAYKKPDGSIGQKYVVDENGNKIPKFVSTINGKEVEASDPNAVHNEDRGLFRINSGTFYDYASKPAIAKKMEEAGITSYDDMYDPEKNVKMAKLIYDRQGWNAWYGASPNIRK